MTPAERMSILKPSRPVKRGGPLQCAIRELRQSLGLTLRDVEKGAKVNNANLHRIENGGDTTLTAARRLCAFFGKTIGELWPERQAARGTDASSGWIESNLTPQRRGKSAADEER